MCNINENLKLPTPDLRNYYQRFSSFDVKPRAGRLKALLLRRKKTTSAPVSAPLRQPLRPATAAAAIKKAQ